MQNLYAQRAEERQDKIRRFVQGGPPPNAVTKEPLNNNNYLYFLNF